MSKCDWCQKGDSPVYLDKDGVRCELSGKLGILSHAYEDSWWPCSNPTPGKVTAAKLNILWYKLGKTLSWPLTVTTEGRE